MYDKNDSLFMQESRVFNPDGDDSAAGRSVWFGQTTNLIQLNDVRFSWALSLYKQMREQFWIPEKTKMGQDARDYASLTSGERRAFDGILSYLTFLDSVQTVNIPHLRTPISAPEIAICLAEQGSQEAMHSSAYQYIIESIIPSDARSRVYELWRTDDVLLERCEYIAGIYQRYVDLPTKERYFESLVANYILEGLYFYNGFSFFYSMGSRQLLPGTADLIKQIHRDELSHVRLYQRLLTEAMAVLPHSIDRIYEMFDAAVTQERLWSSHIIGGDILGITEDSIDCYTKYLANLRLRSLKLDALYPEKKYRSDPYAHFERFADTSKEATTRGNFFEAGVMTAYNMSTVVEGWDEI